MNTWKHFHFSFEMNLALIHMTGADYVVTKESGTAGGFPEKMEAVQAVPARPPLLQQEEIPLQIPRRGGRKLRLVPVRI